MSTIPTLSDLEDAFPGKGEVLHQLLASVAAVREHPAAIHLTEQCFHPPSLRQMRMEALNAELEGYGVEAVSKDGDIQDVELEYINMGDLYSTTLVRLRGGAYTISDVGTLIERDDEPQSLGNVV